MVLKEEFLNLINDINSAAVEYGYSNAKDLSNQAYTQGKLTFDEKEELFRFIQMRNMMSHGGADRVIIFKEDLTRLGYYKKVLYDMLGIESLQKTYKVKEVTERKKKNKEPKEFTPDIFNDSLKPRYTDKASDIVRNKFIEGKGKIHISTLEGIEYDVFLSNDGESFDTVALPIKPGYRFSVFDIVYDLLKKENGRIKKGNGHNYRLGETGCSEKTVCGVIGYEYSKKKTGDSVFDPVFIICAMMEYAGICKNTRGYLVLKSNEETHKPSTNYNSKYYKLSNYLYESNQDIVVLTFSKIEEILGFELPASARKYQPNWSNTYTLSIPRSWLSVGYRVYQVDLNKETIYFRKE